MHKMTIQQTDGGYVTVPLLAKAGIYKFTVGKHTYQMNACVERYIAFMLFVENRWILTREDYFDFFRDVVKNFVSRHANPATLEAMWDAFIKEHPVIDSGPKFDFSQITECGHPEYGLGLVDTDCSCVMPYKFEQKLVEELRNKESLASTIVDYKFKYDIDIDTKWLIQMFLIQHGVCPRRYEWHEQFCTIPGLFRLFIILGLPIIFGVLTFCVDGWWVLGFLLWFVLICDAYNG